MPIDLTKRVIETPSADDLTCEMCGQAPKAVMTLCLACYERVRPRREHWNGTSLEAEVSAEHQRQENETMAQYIQRVRTLAARVREAQKVTP